MKFLFKPISNRKQVGGKRGHSAIKYLVIHDTGNPGTGAGAMAHYRYLQSATRPGSAHYYLDDKEIIQTIGDSRIAWSIGDKWGYKNNPKRIKDARNANSLSIELCINRDCNQAKAYKNLVELTKNLMKKFNIPASRVIRHFDATGKTCPGSWSGQGWAKWWAFKEDIKKPIEWEIDLSKDSTFGEAKKEAKKEEKKKMGKDYVGHWAEKAIEEVKAAGIMTGMPDGAFRPDQPITRAEVAVIMARMLKKK